MCLQMSLKNLLIIVALAGCLACQGCTIKFRATDVELDSVANHTYELEAVSLFDG